MLTVVIAIFENLYFTVFIVLILGIIVIAHRLTHPDYENYSLSLIFLFFTVIGMFIVPESLLWLVFLVFIIILFNIIFSTMLQKFYVVEEDKLLIDRVPQVWETFEIPPETKEAML